MFCFNYYIFLLLFISVECGLPSVDRTGLGATFSSYDIARLSRLGCFEFGIRKWASLFILVPFKFIQSVGFGMEDDCMMIFAPFNCAGDGAQTCIASSRLELLEFQLDSSKYL